MSSVARRPRAMSSFAMLFFRISGPPKLRLRLVSDKTPLREIGLAYKPIYPLQSTFVVATPRRVRAIVPENSYDHQSRRPAARRNLE